jgi:hypothetical protein
MRLAGLTGRLDEVASRRARTIDHSPFTIEWLQPL